ncbi:gephyrin-like molybdotransferase Glp [Aestuariispira insulae]|uniref:Molybdopterin molybdenumtransferase n=1 Tax=Aestuariispira insulae TaxID=1461337 RepID=A0A3D9HUW0_9PROT|nr:gephyrin-like molybdotransferase Glp [Aestuariispira insulae]RED53282.1 molybdopterin molybdochelatase [Aestuariispira insulae]
MISVQEARQRILSSLSALPPEQIFLSSALGRVLAEDVSARCTQPPVAVSAMDGYAVRAADTATVPADLTVIGEAPAGGGFNGVVNPGEAVRIFTGGPVPEGADAVVMQEDTERPDKKSVRIKLAPHEGKFIRPAGLDFSEGETLLRAGKTLNARDIALLAAMNVPWLMVRQRPTVAILATGDEVVMPGEPLGPSQIISSNSLGLAATVEALGCRAQILGIARDTPESLRQMATAAASADFLVTTGGASVGDHDLIQFVLGDEGLKVDFWKIAMRPGKPLIFGQLAGTPMLGLPGNPVSSMVCSLVFLAPALAVLAGKSPDAFERRGRAKLSVDIPENDHREEMLRATLQKGSNGDLLVTPYKKQDSSMLSKLSNADCLLVRPANAPASRAGEEVEIVFFPSSDLSL